MIEESAKMNTESTSPLIEIIPLTTSDVIATSGYGREEEDHGGFGGEWSVGFLTKHNPGLELIDWLSVN